MSVILTNRQKLIVNYLSAAKQHVSGEALAAYLGVSSRTVRSDISDINAAGGRPAVIAFRDGYQLDKNMLDIVVYDEADDKNRPGKIIGILLKDDCPLDIDQLADEVYVSTSTLNRCLPTVRAMLDNFGLKLNRHNNKVAISGTEYAKRRMICALVHDDLDPVFLQTKNFPSFFEQVNLQGIKDIVTSTIKEFDYNIEELYLMNLVINIGIALDRIIKGCSNLEFNITNSLAKDSATYRITRHICQRLEMEYGVTITANDVDYIACLIMGQTKPKLLHHVINSRHTDISPAFSDTVHSILDDVLSYYLIDINTDDFFTAFLLHIKALVERAKVHDHVVNVYIDSLKINCPFIYEVAVTIAKRLSEAFEVDICDDEIGFIAIHIGYAIEQNQHDASKIQTLIVNNDYHQMTRRLLEGLSKRYADKIEVTNVISYAQPHSGIEDADMIITTMDNVHYGSKTVNITPFLSESDMAHIDAKIKEIHDQVVKTRLDGLLTKYFDSSLFFKDQPISDANQAINFLCAQLAGRMPLDLGFKQAILDREKISSTCMNQSFAVPHAINAKSERSAIGVLLTPKPMDWYGTDISVVFILAFCDRDMKDFMEAYNMLIQVLSSVDGFNRVVTAKDYDSFLDVLRNASH